jgi:hypothetical protein
MGSFGASSWGFVVGLRRGPSSWGLVGYPPSSDPIDGRIRSLQPVVAGPVGPAPPGADRMDHPVLLGRRHLGPAGIRVPGARVDPERDCVTVLGPREGRRSVAEGHGPVKRGPGHGRVPRETVPRRATVPERGRRSPSGRAPGSPLSRFMRAFPPCGERRRGYDPTIQMDRVRPADSRGISGARTPLPTASRDPIGNVADHLVPYLTMTAVGFDQIEDARDKGSDGQERTRPGAAAPAGPPPSQREGEARIDAA